MSASVPRIAFDDLPAELHALLAPKVARLGYLGEFFAVGAHQPDALAGFIRFTEALKAGLPHDLTEIVALTVAVVTGNDYERHQHERLALALGFERGWIAAVEGAARGEEPASDRLDDRHVATIQLALAMMRDHGRNASGPLTGLVELVGADVGVGIALTACRYIGHAAVVNAFGISAPVPSIFDSHDDTQGGLS